MPMFDPQPGDTPEDRGRVTALDHRRMLEGIPPLVQAVANTVAVRTRRRRRRKRALKMSQGGMHLLMLMSVAIYGHLTSYDKVLRPRFVRCSGPRVTQPWITEPEATFKLNTRFSRQDFTSVVSELSKVPPTLMSKPGSHGSRFPKALGIYVVVRRLSKGGR